MRSLDLGSDWHARHTDRSRKARNARRQLEALGYDDRVDHESCWPLLPDSRRG
jgi:hypothetical protein